MDVMSLLTTYGPWILGLMGLWLVVAVARNKRYGVGSTPLNAGQENKGMFFVIGAVLLVVGSFWGYAEYTGEAPVVSPVAPAAVIVAPSAAGPTPVTGAAVAPSTSSGKQQSIETITVTAEEAGSGSYTSVGGTYRLFASDINPQDPNAASIASITVASGTGSGTSLAGVLTGVPYRVVFNGANTWYDVDYGVMTFDYEDFNPSTATYSALLRGIKHSGTIDDTLTEINNTDTNGQSDTTSGVGEIAGAADAVTYDESGGDESWYIQPTVSCSGGNQYCQKMVMCFEKDSTNPPEGNEISSISYSYISGKVFPIPSALVNYWSTEQCIQLGDMTGGDSGKFKLSFTQSEANTDTNDDWYLEFDDLGAYNGKDVTLNTGATGDRITVDAQA